LESTYTILEKPIKVYLGDASVILTIGRGSLCYLMNTTNGVVPTIIPNALYVPVLAASLLSVTCFTDQSKHCLIFEDDNCFIHSKCSGHCIATTRKTSGSLYKLIACSMTSKKYTNTAHTSHHIDINILHHHLGHLSHNNVK
jgi:hypothetical protein